MFLSACSVFHFLPEYLCVALPCPATSQHALYPLSGPGGSGEEEGTSIPT